MSESFLAATRRKLRFAAPTSGGQLDLEDLWDLNLKGLDAIAVAVAAVLAPKAKSFLTNPDRKADQEAADNELRLDVLKTIITIKEEENKKAREAATQKQQLDFLKSLREKKQIEALEGLSAEDIEAQIRALENPTPAAE